VPPPVFEGLSKREANAWAICLFVGAILMASGSIYLIGSLLTADATTITYTGSLNRQ
jgi:hypothetical protein